MFKRLIVSIMQILCIRYIFSYSFKLIYLPSVCIVPTYVAMYVVMFVQSGTL